MKKVLITFTKSQIKELEPLFAEIRASGGQDAILGQVFYDGMAAGVIPNKKVLKIQKITMGRTSHVPVNSAMQQMGVEK